MGSVDFELDVETVVDNFHSSKRDYISFGDIVSDCVDFFSTRFNNSSAEFIRRQANEVAHNITKAATSLASFQILVEIPSCIEHVLINELL